MTRTRNRPSPMFEDLMALFKDARAHPENYSAKDRETLKRLSREILNKPADPDRPF